MHSILAEQRVIYVGLVAHTVTSGLGGWKRSNECQKRSVHRRESSDVLLHLREWNSSTESRKKSARPVPPSFSLSLCLSG